MRGSSEQVFHSIGCLECDCLRLFEKTENLKFVSAVSHHLIHVNRVKMEGSFHTEITSAVGLLCANQSRFSPIIEAENLFILLIWMISDPDEPAEKQRDKALIETVRERRQGRRARDKEFIVQSASHHQLKQQDCF